MISDRILDMKDANQRKATRADLRYLYDMAGRCDWDELARAIDGGSNADIRRELRAYWLADRDGFGEEINARKNRHPFTLEVLRFIDSVDWLASF